MTDYENEATNLICDYIDDLDPDRRERTRQEILTQALIYAVLDVAQAIRNRP